MISSKAKTTQPFSERHPRLNTFLGLVMLLVLCLLALLAGYVVLKLIGSGIKTFVDWIEDVSSKMDAVVIVALITGGVSILGVVISSIVAKVYDYRKQRQMYLAQKREKPYGAFVEMVYKIQQNSKEPGSYTQEEMVNDMRSFSQDLTLWGSKKVAYKWVRFRLNGAKPDAAKDNLFVLESILNEMRKDMGVKKAKKGKLLSFFVNDIENA